MPSRPIPLVTGETYHVFNRSIAKQPIFLTSGNYRRAIDLLNFYRFSNLGFRYSHYVRLSSELKKEFLTTLKTHDPQVVITCFTLMPNHFHLLLRQLSENGISNFISHFQNSYAKYFNLKTQRTGSVFQSMFKAIRIETEEQLLHVSRYIHLNPLTSFLLKNIEELKRYNWSSYIDYTEKPIHDFIDPTLLSSYFDTKTKIQEFTTNQIDYQRELEIIKHLLLEDPQYPSVSTQSTPGVG